MKNNYKKGNSGKKAAYSKLHAPKKKYKVTKLKKSSISKIDVTYS